MKFGCGALGRQDAGAVRGSVILCCVLRAVLHAVVCAGTGGLALALYEASAALRGVAWRSVGAVLMWAVRLSGYEGKQGSHDGHQAAAAAPQQVTLA